MNPLVASYLGQLAGSEKFVSEFLRLAGDQADLATAALLIARLEYPSVTPAEYLRQLDSMGTAASERLSALGPDAPARARITALNGYLYEEQGFSGNQRQYNDPRNSFLNEVLERRIGIPISLGVIYMEVARRAGVLVDGVNFPGHFLLRYRRVDDAPPSVDELVLDPFNGGVFLSEWDCRQLLQRHVGGAMVFDTKLLAPATPRQILARMLMNLKRIYVSSRSFPQARAVTELLFALDPSAAAELRDGGLLAYHLGDFSRALADLERYLELSSNTQPATEPPTDREQILEHVRTLRRRVAESN